MSRTLHLRVYVGVSTDLNALWSDIKGYKDVHLSGDGSDYVINYDGDTDTGIAVVKACVSHAEAGKFYADFG